MAWDCVFLILNGELWRKDKWTRALTLSSKLQMQTHRKVKTQLETGLSFQTKEPSSFLVVKLAAVPALLNIYPVYSDDNAMVSKNTDVIVKRMPAMRGMGILSRMKNQDSGNAMISSSNLSVPYLSTCLLMKVSFADAQRLAPLYARPSAYFELFVLCIAQALHLIFCVKQKVAL